MTKGVRLAKGTLVVFGVFLAGVAFLTLRDKSFPWRALIFVGGSALCFALVRATPNSSRRGRGEGGGRGGSAAGVPVRPVSPVLVGSAAHSFPTERE